MELLFITLSQSCANVNSFEEFFENYFKATKYDSKNIREN